MTLTIHSPREKNDCGVCAVACLAELTWSQAKKAIWPGLSPRPGASLATTGRQLIEALSPLGWKSKWPRMRPTSLVHAGFANISMNAVDRAIARIQYADSRCWHWVVWDGKYVYDSNYPEPREVYRPHVETQGRLYLYKPLSYIVFEPCPTVKRSVL